MKTALITGASGFIGQVLCHKLLSENVKVMAMVRDEAKAPAGTIPILCRDMTAIFDWAPLLKGIDVVYHLAGQTHGVRGGKRNKRDYACEKLRAINITPTQRLVDTAVKVGVKRLVYVSSIRVYGESSAHPFSESDQPHPSDDYGWSKLEAERIVRDSGLESVIVRSPLVYGPGVKGNFRTLLPLCDSSWPLPLGGINNQRSFIYVENLAQALFLCGTSAKAAGETFVVRDGQDQSTSDLIKQIRSQFNQPARLLSGSRPLLFALTYLSGRREAYHRLVTSFQLNDDKIRDVLGFKPPFTFKDGLNKTVKWYRQISEAKTL